MVQPLHYFGLYYFMKEAPSIVLAHLLEPGTEQQWGGAEVRQSGAADGAERGKSSFPAGGVSG